MNLLHLQYFYIVAKEGSFSKASQILKINQPAISRMVKNLEESLGFELLERYPRGVKLTQRGEPVFAKAGEIFSKVDDLKREAGTLNQVCTGPLHFGCTDMIASFFGAPTIQKMLAKWPLVYPNAVVGTSSYLTELITKGALEFGLFFHIPELPMSLAITKRWPTKYHLVVSANHSKDKEVMSRFIGSREIDDTLTKEFPTLKKYQKKNSKAAIGVSSNSLLLHKELVLKGCGISVLPEFLIGKELKSGKLKDLLPEENLVFDMKLVQRKNIELSLNAKTFISYLEDKT